MQDGHKVLSEHWHHGFAEVLIKDPRPMPLL